MKIEEISDAYLDVLDDYIQSDMVIPGRDMLHILGKAKKRKQDAYGNPIEKKNPNPVFIIRFTS